MLPMQELMEADFFLFLLSQTFKDDTGLRRHYWRAWSCLYLSQAPKFVRDSSRTRIAEKVAGVLGVSVDDYKEILSSKGPGLTRLFNSGYWRYPIRQDQIDQIATT